MIKNMKQENGVAVEIPEIPVKERYVFPDIQGMLPDVEGVLNVVLRKGRVYDEAGKSLGSEQAALVNMPIVCKGVSVADAIIGLAKQACTGLNIDADPFPTTLDIGYYLSEKARVGGGKARFPASVGFLADQLTKLPVAQDEDYGKRLGFTIERNEKGVVLPSFVNQVITADLGSDGWLKKVRQAQKKYDVTAAESTLLDV